MLKPKFGGFEKQREESGIITRLTDRQRLHWVDPKTIGFFDRVIQCKSEVEGIKDFIEKTKAIKANPIEAFYEPLIEPTVTKGQMQFVKGKEVTTGLSCERWSEVIKETPKVENYRWTIMTLNQWYCSCIEAANKWIEKGCSTEQAIMSAIKEKKEKKRCLVAVWDGIEDCNKNEWICIDFGENSEISIVPFMRIWAPDWDEIYLKDDCICPVLVKVNLPNI